MVNPVDLASNEHPDLTVLPPLFVCYEIRDEQSQAYWKTSNRGSDTKLKQSPYTRSAEGVFFKTVAVS